MHKKVSIFKFRICNSKWLSEKDFERKRWENMKERRQMLKLSFNRWSMKTFKCNNWQKLNKIKRKEIWWCLWWKRKQIKIDWKRSSDLKKKWFEDTLNSKINENLTSRNKRQSLRLKERKSLKDWKLKRKSDEKSKSILKTFEMNYNSKNTRKCYEKRKEEKRQNEFKTRRIY